LGPKDCMVLEDTGIAWGPSFPQRQADQAQSTQAPQIPKHTAGSVAELQFAPMLQLIPFKRAHFPTSFIPVRSIHEITLWALKCLIFFFPLLEETCLSHPKPPSPPRRVLRNLPQAGCSAALPVTQALLRVVK